MCDEVCSVDGYVVLSHLGNWLFLSRVASPNRKSVDTHCTPFKNNSMLGTVSMAWGFPGTLKGLGIYLTLGHLDPLCQIGAMRWAALDLHPGPGFLPVYQP